MAQEGVFTQQRGKQIRSSGHTWQERVRSGQLVGVVLVPAADGQLADGGGVGKLQVGGVPVEQALLQLLLSRVCAAQSG